MMDRVETYLETLQEALEKCGIEKQQILEILETMSDSERVWLDSVVPDGLIVGEKPKAIMKMTVWDGE